MKYNIIGRNIEVGDRTKEKVIDKLNRLERLFPEETKVNVSLKTEKINSVVEVTIPMSKRLLRAESSETDMMVALDKVVDILERQIVKYKKRMLTKSRQNVKFKDEYESITVSEKNEKDLKEEPFKIERNKRFELIPMDADEAVMQMELLQHSFFVFRNGSTDEINVVYKRKDGSYGLIEPEF